MHPSTHAALALLLLSAQPVQAQAPLPQASSMPPPWSTG
jgi:hypothetical protein